MGYQKTAFNCLRDGLTIRGFEFIRKEKKKSGSRLPAVIISHGFTSSHHSTDIYGRYFAQRGYVAYTFDFNGGGPRCKSDGAMQDMTVRTETEDLKSVIDYVRQLAYIDTDRIILMGCSQGAFVSALAAGQIPEKISGLILFYPAISLADDARMGELMGLTYDPRNPPEIIDLKIMKVGRQYPLVAQQMHEYEEILPYRGPVLIVHGTADQIVNVAYSKQAWITYTAGSIPEQVTREENGTALDPPFLPALPDGCCPSASRQLMLIAGAGHGFHHNRAHHQTSLFAVKEFLKGYTEILTIDVHLTDIKRQTKGIHTHVELPFTGTADSPWFKGEIQEGAQDTQELTLMHADTKCADYVIKGRDYTGEACKIHVINRGSGSGWKPTVTTDSKALDFLNGADCDAWLTQRTCGPLVRIYAHVMQNNGRHSQI